MPREDETPTVSRLDLELLALGRLPDARLAEINALAADDPELAERVAKVRAEIDDAAQDLPMLRLPSQEAAEPSPWLRWLPFLITGALAAGIGGLALIPETPTEGVTLNPTQNDVRFRGGMDLKIWRVRDGAAQEEDGLIDAAPGDRVQYQVTSAEAAWLSVFNVQDDGELSTYLPPTQLAPGAPQESAVKLDDYAGAERIFFILSPTPVTEDAAQSARQRAWETPLAELDALPGLDDATQRSVLLVKPAEAQPE